MGGRAVVLTGRKDPMTSGVNPILWALGLTTAGRRKWCGWHRCAWGAQVTLSLWPLLTLHSHLIPAVSVTTQPTVWGEGAVKIAPHSSSLQVPPS